MLLCSHIVQGGRILSTVRGAMAAALTLGTCLVSVHGERRQALGGPCQMARIPRPRGGKLGDEKLLEVEGEVVVLAALAISGRSVLRPKLEPRRFMRTGPTRTTASIVRTQRLLASGHSVEPSPLRRADSLATLSRRSLRLRPV
jgi:hypothetical protein